MNFAVGCKGMPGKLHSFFAQNLPRKGHVTCAMDVHLSDELCIYAVNDFSAFYVVDFLS